MAALDAGGRIADSGVVRALGWVPGTRLHIHEGAGLVVLRADRQGVFTVTGQGHLLLPAAVRQWCGLAAGDRVLLGLSCGGVVGGASAGGRGRDGRPGARCCVRWWSAVTDGGDGLELACGPSRVCLKISILETTSA
ncbi:hypothetical protein [Micromonospora wenchangensis]|uniref:hypothetical protein n=1 Tax=Micromonospora wenchangensis TaxID=1185415 RepID=UPI003802297F